MLSFPHLILKITLWNRQGCWKKLNSWEEIQCATIPVFKYLVLTYISTNIEFSPSIEHAPGGGHGSPLQYSWLENPTDRGAWRAMVHEVAQSQTWLKRLNTDARIKHVWAPRMFLLVCVCLVTQSCLTVCDPLSVACQTPLSLGFFRQAYWSALPFPNLCVRYHWIVAKYKACMSPLECVSSWSGLISVHNLWRSGFSGAFIDAHNWIKEWLSPLEVGMGMGIWEKSLNCR